MPKEKLDLIIRNTFPDTKEVDFHIEQRKVQSWIECRLLPFLIFQNSHSTTGKIINLFLPELSISRSLLPAYFTIALYQKTIKQILLRLKYQTQFDPNTVPVVHKGTVSFIDSIDYLNKSIHIKNGMGATTHVKFQDFYQVKWAYAKSKGVQKQIESFLDLKEAENSDFFNFPIQPKDSDFEGLIYFTNKGSFKDLLRKIEVNGMSITSNIHIQEVIYYSETDKFVLRSISERESILRKPVTLIIASRNDIYAFENIINDSAGKLKHIKTIAIDDFDDRVIKEKLGTDKGLAVLEQNFKDYLVKHLHNGTIHSIYLVNKNHSILDVNEFSSRDVFKPFIQSWLITPTQHLDIEQIEEINHSINFIQNESVELEQLSNKIEELTIKWRSLLDQYWCNGETVKGLVKLFWLGKIINGIYSPKQLKIELSNFNRFLKEFSRAHFQNGSDNGLIKDTIDFIQTVSDTRDQFLNHKLRKISGILSAKGNVSSLAVVNSFQSTADDLNYFRAELKNINPDIVAMLIAAKDPFGHQEYPSLACDLFFILTFSGKWKAAPFVNLYGKEMFYLLNSSQFHYAKSFQHAIKPAIKKFSSQSSKSNLLQIDDSIFTKAERQSIVTFSESSLKPTETNQTGDPFQELSYDAIINTVFKSWRTSDNPNDDGPKVCIITDDGSSYTWSESKKVFSYLEGTTSIDDCFKLAKDLKEGDKIILLKQDYKQNTDIKQIIEEILSATPQYNETLRYYYEWRKLMSKKLNDFSNDYSQFVKRLNECGFETTAHTISNWIDGTTTYPQNFSILLPCLEKMGVLESNNIAKYYQAVKTVKSLQITFIREAIKKLFSDLQGLTYSTENVAINEEVINSFIDKIDVKRIETVLIPEYAD